MKNLSTRVLCTLAALAGAVAASPALATCSTEPYLGSICITAATYCPTNYLDANGQTMAIAQNSALFSLLGTTYGGNGVTTFQLPNLQSRLPLGIGQGAGLSPVQQGEVSGQESVTLSTAQLPAHSHTAQLHGLAAAGNTDSPAGAVPAQLSRSNNYSNAAANTAMGASAITVGSTGSNQPVALRNPYLGLRYCIAIQGLYPSRP
ncbi:MAG: tail fiber protein [Burkholderiales bacterium]|nr:tail fiber protein [Burkholderiales bacterium]